MSSEDDADDLLPDLLISNAKSLSNILAGELSPNDDKTDNQIDRVMEANGEPEASNDEYSLGVIAKKAYCEEKGDIVIRMVDASFTYSYEYQGSAAKVVHTNLTNKCYLTLTQALHMGMGGNPFGPAGTGKTETVKALGALLGRQVVVFNCDEALDVESIARIFIGLARSGAWGCFDEFNRLDLSTLSSVAVLIKGIQGAVNSMKKQTIIQETEVQVNPNTAIFITLNPANKGYLGRSKLPDNLKQLFRPILMAAPDTIAIAEVILLAEGFTTAKQLAEKTVMLYCLAKNLMSKQRHYDWGLRSLKGVLLKAGSLLRTLSSPDSKKESETVKEAVKMSNMSKLTVKDAQNFEILMDDFFPTVGLEFSMNSVNFAKVLKNLNYKEMDSQISRVSHFLEQLLQRNGVIIVGPPASGKSSLWKIVAEAFKNVSVHVINPKAVTRDELLGYVDDISRQWYDGIFTKTVREALLEDPGVMRWIVFDGCIDPEWIESFNSILDDNRILTLPSGDRLTFDSNLKLIFETDDLSLASPATITRLGVVLTSEDDLVWQKLVEQFLEDQKFTSTLCETIHTVIHNIICKHKMKLGHAVPFVLKVIKHLGHSKSERHVLESLISALPTSLYKDSGFIKEIFTEFGENLPPGVPANELLYNSDLDRMTYADADFLFDEDDGHFTTSQTSSCVEYIKKFLTHGEKILFLQGPSSSGKSFIVSIACSQLGFEKPVFVTGAKFLDHRIIIRKIKEICNAHTRIGQKVLRPAKGKAVLVIQDLERSYADKWKTSPLEEFLYQFHSYGGFYDVDLEWVSLENVTFVCSITEAILNQRLMEGAVSLTIRSPGLEEERKVIYLAFQKLGEKLIPASAIQQFANLTTKLYEKVRTMKGDGLICHPYLEDIIDFVKALFSLYPTDKDHLLVSWSVLADEFYSRFFQNDYAETFKTLKYEAIEKVIGGSMELQKLKDFHIVPAI
ncbi:hypothetical protein QYM36_016355, partial [Artemia franciscana]